MNNKIVIGGTLDLKKNIGGETTIESRLNGETLFIQKVPASKAEEVLYDNEHSHLKSGNVQAAIDELADESYYHGIELNMKVDKTTKVNNKELKTDIEIDANDVGLSPIPLDDLLAILI